MSNTQTHPALAGQVDRHVRPLPKTQAALLEALRKGVTLHYMPYMGTFNPAAYYFRDDNHQRVTAAATALLSKGLAETYDVTWRGHRVRAKALPAA
ncbi:MAG: hypothetical protein HY855_02745 [Burkholderiales bacterium]|nr:hypothetical protein [Burkholderiales bacterium]